MNFGTDWDSEHRRTLLDSRATLERASTSVARSQAIASETEQLGTDVIQELGGQRETLLRAKQRLSETDQELTRAHKTIKLIKRAFFYNKILLQLIILVEIIILCSVVYIRFFQKKK